MGKLIVSFLAAVVIYCGIIHLLRSFVPEVNAYFNQFSNVTWAIIFTCIVGVTWKLNGK